MTRLDFGRRLLPLLAVATVTACASSQIMIGQPRAPISPDQVQIYMQPPPGRYEQIARLDTSSAGSFAFTAQAKTDSVLKRLKEHAAKLGANGVILQGIGDAPGATIGAGGGQDSFSRNSAVGIGLGGSFELSRKAGTGLAIYLPPP